MVALPDFGQLEWNKNSGKRKSFVVRGCFIEEFCILREGKILISIWEKMGRKGGNATYSRCVKPYSTFCKSSYLRRRSAAARLLRSWVRIPPGAWMSACCECCVLSGRGLCDEITTRPEESYRLWWVAVCDIETSSLRSQTSTKCD